MDVTSYREVKALFQTAWDPAILEALAEGPARFLTLARRIRTVDPALIDGSVTRSLKRLRELELVRKVRGRDDAGRVCQLYQLTDDGQKLLAHYRAIMEAYRRSGEGAAGE